MTSTGTYDRDGVLAMNDALRDAFNAHDAAAFASHWLDDADHVNVTGDVLIGSNGVRASTIPLFAGPFAGVQSTVEIRDLRFLAPNVAILDLNQKLTGVPGPPNGEVHTRVKIVALRRDDRWRVASFQNTAIGRPGGPPERA